MNEENRKKREWVKSAAIVFLSVMLVLTFFSNTIMNYSLPEVATQMIMSGSITSKIRGTGTVESGDPYNVEVAESRKVTSVAVRVGDEVAVGDVLFYLEDKDSDELMAAEKNLADLKKTYDINILTGLDAALVSKVESGNVATVEEHKRIINNLKAKMDAAQKEVDTAQKVLDDANAWVNALNFQISITQPANIDVNKQEIALNSAKANLDKANLKLADAQEAYDTAVEVSGNDPAAILAAEQELEKARREVETCTANVASCQTALDTARLNADNALLASEQAKATLNAQLPDAQLKAYVAQKTLDEKNKVFAECESAYNDYIAMIPTEFDLVSQLEAIRQQEALVEELRQNSVGAKIKAEIAGTVTALNVLAGQSTSPGSPAAVIQPAGKGYTLSISVTKEQAQRVSVGDPGELVNSWWYNDVQAVVASIRPDKADPTKMKTITFNLTGEVADGQSLSLSVGSKSASYDMIVPNSSIREDNNGKFILIVEQQSSPLGNRYRATRVDVQVVASDDTRSAITGGVYGWESVITTSTKPVEAGQLVRLPD